MKAACLALDLQNDVVREDVAVGGTDTPLNRITGSTIKPEYRDEPDRLGFTATSRVGFSRDQMKRMLGWEPHVDRENGIPCRIEWHEKARSVSGRR